MGYCYDRQNGLVCDQCGSSGAWAKVVKRRCPQGYCPPPALCAGCFAAEGGTRGIHGEKCRAGAAAMKAEEDEKRAAMAGGEMFVRAAFGGPDEGRGIAAGTVGVMFTGAGDSTAYRLVTSEAYREVHHVHGLGTRLAHFPGAQEWTTYPGSTAKELVGS